MSLFYARPNGDGTFEVINQVDAQEAGWQQYDLEVGYDMNFYLVGTAPTRPLDEVKAAKIVELKNERTMREEAPVEYKEKLWDFDSKSRDRIISTIFALESKDIESITWTAFDNSSLELTIEDLKNIISAAAVRGNSLHKYYRILRDLVNDASSIEEIKSINWQ